MKQRSKLRQQILQQQGYYWDKVAKRWKLKGPRNGVVLLRKVTEERKS